MEPFLSKIVRFYYERTPSKVFSRQIYGIFQNSSFTEYLLATASQFKSSLFILILRIKCLQK